MLKKKKKGKKSLSTLGIKGSILNLIKAFVKYPETPPLMVKKI